MNFLYTFGVVFALFVSMESVASAAEKDMEVSCNDGFYTCLTSDDLKSLSGKTLKYKHPRAGEFGTVTVTLRSNSWLNISNAKGSASGTWAFKNDQIDLDIVTWGEKYSFRFVRIGDRLFVIPNHGTGGVLLAPVEITG